jgi:hypothetical protein
MLHTRIGDEEKKTQFRSVFSPFRIERRKRKEKNARVAMTVHLLHRPDPSDLRTHSHSQWFCEESFDLVSGSVGRKGADVEAASEVGGGEPRRTLLESEKVGLASQRVASSSSSSAIADDESSRRGAVDEFFPFSRTVDDELDRVAADGLPVLLRTGVLSEFDAGKGQDRSLSVIARRDHPLKNDSGNFFEEAGKRSGRRSRREVVDAKVSLNSGSATVLLLIRFGCERRRGGALPEVDVSGRREEKVVDVFMLEGAKR